jgi:uncharacterized protein YegP (UPF0339 family)
MRLEIHEDNGALYHWALVTDGGELVAKSAEAFTARDGAVRAASDLSEQAAAGPIEVR